MERWTGWRRWVIGLGWLGLGLVVADFLTVFLPFETTCTSLVRSFNLVRNILFGLVGPVAVWLHVAPEKGKKPESTAAGLVVLFALPWLFFLVIFMTFSFFLEDVAPDWETEQVLYASHENPRVQVVSQAYSLFTTSSIPRRVVKLTPVLGFWQLVEPVDTTRFDSRGWQRVAR